MGKQSKHMKTETVGVYGATATRPLEINLWLWS